MTRARDVANVLTAASNLATDTETAAAISTHAALSDPHAGYLKESEYVAAGKNKIINGDFGIWQRGTSFTTAVYTADRWHMSWSGTTTFSLTRQAFTAGSAPVAGYESQYFARFARTAGSADDYFLQRIEDARTFAGQTVTLSFWAKASASTTISQVYCAQSMGSGGSGGSGAGSFSGISITTSWARYSVTFVMPSIAGGTVGTNSFVETVFKFGSAMGNITVDLWGVQLEAGSQATPYHNATPNQQAELAACERYYEVIGGTSTAGITIGGVATGASQAFYFPYSFRTTKRTTPTLSKTGTWGISNATQPQVAFPQTSGFTLYGQSLASGMWYVQADSVDDTIIASAEL